MTVDHVHRVRRARRVRLFGVVIALAAILPATAIAAPVGPQATVRATGESLFAFDWVAPTRERPAVNWRRAGTWVGVYFTLGGDHGLDVVTEGWPKARQVGCRTGDPVPGTLRPTKLPGATGLRYEAASDTYTYALRVPPSWGTGPGRCREFLLKLTDGSVHRLDFRFKAPPTDEPPPPRDCADVIDGTGVYISLDPVTQEPLPEPRADFILDLDANSCTVGGDGKPTRYRMFVFEGTEGVGRPTWPLPIAAQTVIGDGTSNRVNFSITIDGDAPDAICALALTKEKHAVLERAPDWPFFSCGYVLDEGPPGRSGFE